MIEYSFDHNGKSIGSTKDLWKDMISISVGLIETPDASGVLFAIRLSITHINDHVPNDFVIGNSIRILLLCLEEAVEKVILAISKFGVLHALHKALDRETSSDRKVVKLVEGTGPLWVLTEPFV